MPYTRGKAYTISASLFGKDEERERLTMNLLWWAVLALIVAVIAGALGFTGVARGAATISRWLFGIFLFIAVGLFLLIALGIVAA